MSRHLTEKEFLVHPLVGDVVELYQQSGFGGIDGLGAQGVEQTTMFLEDAKLIPRRSPQIDY